MGGAGGIRDLAGNALPADETWTFSTAAYVNKIANPGFEVDANGDGRPDSWTSNAAFSRSAPGYTGEYSGRFYSTKNKGCTIGQTVTGLTAGSPYQFSGWVNIPQTTDQFTFRFNIVWKNTRNSTISTQTVTTYSGPTSGWVEASGSYVAPAGATRAQINMVVTSLNAIIYVDDIVFR